jgi:hypothetical protein
MGGVVPFVHSLPRSTRRHCGVIGSCLFKRFKIKRANFWLMEVEDEEVEVIWEMFRNYNIVN